MIGTILFYWFVWRGWRRPKAASIFSPTHYESHGWPSPTARHGEKS